MAFTLIDLAGGTGGASEININIELQSKTVDSSTNSQLVKPTDGYIGIKDVTVNPYVLDSSSATITENGDYVFTSAEDGLSRVDVSVNIPDPALDEKTVDSSTVLQEVTSDAYGLRKVTVNPYVLSPLEVNSSTASQEFTGQYGTVTVNPYTLDSKTVDSSTNSQTITSDEDGLSSVTVNPYVLDSSTVDPSTNQIVVTSSEDGLSSVTVNGVTSSIDSNILASNIKDGVTILGVQGTFEGGTLQSKTADSSTESQLIEPDYGNYGLSSVTVNPYTLDSSSLVITENGDYAVESTADGLSRVDVSVNIDTQSYYDSGYSAGEADGIVEGIAEQKAKLDSSTLTNNGTYTREDGWNEITVDVDTVNNQNKTVDSSTNSQLVSPDQGYTGLGQVVVNPYILDSKTVDSSTVAQTIVSSEDGLSSVIVNPYVLDSSTLEITTNGQYAVTSSVDGLSRVDVSVGIDTQSYYDAGYSAGETAGIAEQKAKLDSSTFTDNGTYTREDGWNSITVDVDTVNNQNKTVDSSTNSQLVSPDQGYTGLGTVTVNPYTLDSKTVDSSTVAQTVVSDVDGLSQVTVNPYTVISRTVDASVNSQIILPEEEIPAYVEKVSGSAYYALNHYPTINDRIEIDFYAKSSGSFRFGNKEYSGHAEAVGMSNNYGPQFGNGSASVSIVDAGRHVVSLSKDAIVVDNVSTPNDATSVFGNNLFLLAINVQVSSPLYTGAGDKVYYVKIWTNNVLTHYWVPVYVDDTYKLYDRVTGTYIAPTGDAITGYAGETIEYDALSQVTVNAVTREIDSNIQAGNIKDGVTILGVQGTYTGGSTINNQNKSVDSSTNAQSVTYDSGYTGLGTVTVNPYTLTTSSIDSSTAAQTVNIPTGYNGLSSVTISGLDLDSCYTLAASI